MGRKAKPDLFYFNKFVRALIEEDAEIKIYGNSYQSSNKHLTIKSLLAETCDFPEDSSKLDDVVRKTMELKKEHSITGKITKKQRQVFRQLDFYFGKSERTKTEPHNNFNKFFIEENSHALELFPQLSDKVNHGIEWAVTRKGIIQLIDLIPALTSTGGPFRKLFDKIRFTAPLEDESFRNKIQEGFEAVWQEYQRVYVKEQSQKALNGPLDVIIPGYLTPTQSPFSDLNGNIKKESNFHSNDETLLGNYKNWFDDQRYERLKALSPKLINKDVTDWPKWSTEHIILSELEYQYFYWEVWHQVLNLLQDNLRFVAYYSSTRETIEVEERITDIHELGEKLIQYNIPGNFEDHINLRRGTIIKGDFSKYPKKLSAQNTHNSFQVKLKIVQHIAQKCFEKLYSSIGLDRKNWSPNPDNFRELAHRVLRPFDHS